MLTSLNSILKEVIVFPYNNEMIDTLSSVCQSYAKKISLRDFEACLLFLCQGKRHDGLVTLIEDKAQKVFPDRVYRALAGYIVLWAMVNNELTKQNKVLFSLMVRNVMVFSFTSSDVLVRQCISPEFYDPFDEYWSGQSEIGGLPKSKLFPKIFTSSTFDELGCTAEELYPALQFLAKQNERSVYYKSVSQIRKAEGDDDYSFAVSVVNEIQSYGWHFVDPYPVGTIMKTGLRALRRKTLAQIRDVIDIDKMSDYKYSASSILLRYLYNNDYPKLSGFKMNPLHFAIALYYELMFESIKECNNE